MTRQKRFVVVGVGGVGTAAARALLAGGVRHVTLVDGDVVEATNLARQPLYTPAQVGLPKVWCLAQALSASGSDTSATAVGRRVDRGELEWIWRLEALVLDSTDDASLKVALADSAARGCGTLVYAGAIGMRGAVMSVRQGGPCLRCVFGSVAPDGPTCAEVGVLGPVPGLLGWLQAAVALQPSAWETGTSRLYSLDVAAGRYRQLRVAAVPDCPACSGGVGTATAPHTSPPVTELDLRRAPPVHALDRLAEFSVAVRRPKGERTSCRVLLPGGLSLRDLARAVDFRSVQVEFRGGYASVLLMEGPGSAYLTSPDAYYPNTDPAEKLHPESA